MPQFIETVFSAELPVHEKLLVRKRRIVPPNLENASAEELASVPRLAVVTGIHGDELEGQYIAYELGRILCEHPEQLRGIVDIYPAINPLGINNIERGVPMYDLDLNRTFPGHKDGPLTEALAAAVIEDIAGATVCVDMHASNIFLREMPQVRINVETAEELVPLAPLLNVDFVWVHASATVLVSTLAYSLNSLGTKTFVVESGVGMRITPECDEHLTQGLLRLAKHFGIWEGQARAYGFPIVSTDKSVGFLNAEAAGVFLPEAVHGSRVAQGQFIGKIVDPLTGEVGEEVFSPKDGLLFTLREYPIVHPGSLIARVLGDL